MDEDFFDRLDKYMNINNLNDNKITVQAGLPVGALGKQRRGSRGLSVQSIAKILHTYPDLNAEWLITGDGEMIKVRVDEPSDPNNCFIGKCSECRKKDQLIADLKENILSLEEINETQKDLISEWRKMIHKDSLN